MKRLLFVIHFIALSSFSFAQSITHEQITSFSYEDASDLLRLFPGMYPMDYGVLGAPMIIRPWGLSPWLIGAERDGIPWNRVSDGLWNSNLDMPDEMDTLRIEHTGTEPFGRFSWSRRVIPSDSPRTELHVREGYYGFGRVDFAHAQRFSPKVEAEASGRLNWYDGMRVGLSKARLYNLRGSVTYDLSDAWSANLEYGGANSDVQSPHTITIDSSTGAKTHISVYDEREYGTLRFMKSSEHHSFDLGVHLRQDREIHDNYFRLREQMWYGFAQASITRGPWSGSAKLDYEHADMDFPGVRGMSLSKPGLCLQSSYKSALGLTSAAGNAGALSESNAGENSIKGAVEGSAQFEHRTPQLFDVSLNGGATFSHSADPSFWRLAEYETQHRPLAWSSESLSGVNENEQAHFGGFSARRTQIVGLFYGGEWSNRSSKINLIAQWHNVDYPITDNVVGAINIANVLPQRSVFGSSDLALLAFLRLQSWSFVQLDNEDYSRAMDTRSYSRLLFEKDFLKAPLHVASFVAYEHIGRHDATSDLGSETLGPAHLMHVRVSATIQGVTLYWGVDNLTGQHYYYLPGYPMIAKEEYFGLKWTLTL